MKKITLLFAFVASAMFAGAQLVVTDDFNYSVGSELKANGWVGTGGTPSTTNPILVTSSSITYTGYPNSGVGQEISLTTSGEDLNKSFTAITAGTIYFSALVNFSDAQATGDYFMHIGNSPTGTTFFARLSAKLDNSKIAFGILNTSGGTVAPTYTSSNYDLNTTYLVVVKYSIDNNTSSLVINPSITAEPTEWITNNQGTTSKPAEGFATINLRQGTSSKAPTLKLDGIRVATSWSALFPTTSVNSAKESKLELIVSGKNLLVKNVAEGSEIEIFSALGSKVLNAAVENGKVSISKLKSGIYIVRSGKLTQKIRL